jgi:hypothetical protein
MPAYYYAGGRKIALENDDEHVAVDQQAAEKAGLTSSLPAQGPQRGNGVVLTSRSALDPAILARLRSAGALHPVYKRDHAVVVALPEVRVEFDTDAQRSAVMAFLAKREPAEHSIVEQTNDRVIVRPASGSGDDALRMANDIYEHAHPAAASVRFVQFVPKPSVTRS